jgi:hypothetical protein
VNDWDVVLRGGRMTDPQSGHDAGADVTTRSTTLRRRPARRVIPAGARRSAAPSRDGLELARSASLPEGRSSIFATAAVAASQVSDSLASSSALSPSPSYSAWCC